MVNATDGRTLVHAGARTTDQTPDVRAVLLYDGECGFCAGSVHFVLEHERASARLALRFAPLQGAFGDRVRRQHPELAGIDSVVWYEPPPAGSARESRVRVRSAAALAILAHLGGPWRLVAALGRLVPRVVRDAVYRAIARRRFDIAAPACLLPTSEQRSRFLT